MYIPRAAEATILSLSRSFPVLLVTGSRQVGKTTMLKKLAAEERKYVTLDDPDARYLATADPGLFIQRYSPPVLIDEIQYAPQILPYIKMKVDDSHEAGSFWLTGSQAFHLMKGVSESLAGRVGIMELPGISQAELQGMPSEPFTVDEKRIVARAKKIPPMDVSAVYRRIFRGSMPALVSNGEVDWENFYASYINSYLQRDIHALSQVGDEMAFYNFMTLVAARTARPVVYEELAKEAGISAPTAKQWLSLLVSSHIVVLVRPYSSNMLKRVTKMPLLHFLDTGLCAHLLRWNTPEVLEKGAMSGAFFESYAFSEIYKSYVNAGKIPPLYYYRDKEGKEIDLLLVSDGEIHPIEIKKAVSPGTDALRHFSVITPVSRPEASPYPMQIGGGAVICMHSSVMPLDRKNVTVPVWTI